MTRWLKLAALLTLIGGAVYAAEIRDLDPTDANNTARFPENMAPSAVNDGARALEAILARWHRDLSGYTIAGGDGDTITLAATQTITSYEQGLRLAFMASGSNTGAVTLNVDSVGADSVLKYNDQALESGDIEDGQMVEVIHDGTNWQLVVPPASGIDDDNTATLTNKTIDGDDNTVQDLGSDIFKATGASANRLIGFGASGESADVSVSEGVTQTGTTVRLATDELTEISSADTANDRLIIFDDTDSTHKRIAPDDLGLDTGPVTAEGTTAASTVSSVIFHDLEANKEYKIFLSNVRPASDGVVPIIRMSTDNGTTFENGAQYDWATAGGDNGSAFHNSDTSDTEIQLLGTSGTQGNAANEFMNCEITVHDPGASAHHHINWQCAWTNTGGAPAIATGQAKYKSTTAVDAIEFSFGGTNTTEGDFTIHEFARQ